MKVGDVIHVRAHKADGTCYRSWDATVEAVDDRHIVMFTPKGTSVVDIWKGEQFTDYDYRATYWFDRPYTFIEGFDESANLVEIYIHICSPPQIVEGELHYVDYELDVGRVMPSEAFVMDEDEFAEAIVKYGYSTELQTRCRQAISEALAIANAVEPSLNQAP